MEIFRIKFPKKYKNSNHDPTELKGKDNKLRELLENFDVITIRKSVQDFIKKHTIKKVYFYHILFMDIKNTSSEKCDYYTTYFTD